MWGTGCVLYFSHHPFFLFLSGWSADFCILYSTPPFVLAYSLLPSPASLLGSTDHTPCFCFLLPFTQHPTTVSRHPSPCPEAPCHGGLQWLNSSVPFSFSLHDLSHLFFFFFFLPGPFFPWFSDLSFQGISFLRHWDCLGFRPWSLSLSHL